MTNSQAWNRYSYVNNSPIMYVDPSGHVPCYDGDCGYSVDSFLLDYNYANAGSLPCMDGMCRPESSGQPGGVDEDVEAGNEQSENGGANGGGYPDFDPDPAPDWMPGFMARDWTLAQNAIWIIMHPNATADQKAFAGRVLGGYMVGYGYLIAGLAGLGYAGADAILWKLAGACISNPTCATLTGIGGAGAANEVSDDVADDWAELSGMLKDAANGKGNFGLGEATVEQADAMGHAWVGPNPSIASNGNILISQDGLRQFRPPAFKPSLGIFQANFEYRIYPSGQWFGNGHLDIIP